MTEPDPLRFRCDVSEHDVGRGTLGRLLVEVVLDEPDAVVTALLGMNRLLDDIVESTLGRLRRKGRLYFERLAFGVESRGGFPPRLCVPS